MAGINRFNPEVYGYEYAKEIAPKMQLAPMGWRGYIEMCPVRSIKQSFQILLFLINNILNHI
ncbi:MAG: hypothetical protein BGN88_09980 [Clostridiales bacterium 43-6]|nr:MAG: hypothetical protein BGN88_09980 [Clostridiales bacterium 43-6]